MMKSTSFSDAEFNAYITLRVEARVEEEKRIWIYARAFESKRDENAGQFKAFLASCACQFQKKQQLLRKIIPGAVQWSDRFV